MKPFRSILLDEAAGKSRVVLFGRMNPPTSGHEENVQAAHKIAQKHGAELHVVASHSHDAKKNPLSPEHKSQHLNRAFGHLKNTTVTSSSKEAPSILHQASKAHAAGVHHLIIAGGSDRADMHKLLKQYNGKEGKHGYYNFKKISAATTGERKAGISGTDMRTHASAGHFDKFKQHLPSRIAGNEKHARELYDHVRSGMGVHKESYSRDHYVAGIGFKLGDIVEDSFTGLEGRIVYRGPTYVTLQIDEDVSFKRWVEDVEPQTQIPADLKQHHLHRLKFCPGAVTEFSRMLDDSSLDQSIVLTALDKTAHYLDIEEHASSLIPSTLNDHSISEFVSNMRAASQLLNALGVLPAHESYMEMHAHQMMNIVHGNAPGPKEESMENFKNFYVQEAADIEDPGTKHLTDRDLADIESHIDKLEWEDIRHLYDDQEHQEMEESFNTELDEALTAAQRMKKRFEFMKTKAKREIAAKIARKRLSSPGKLKQKSIKHARALILAKVLKGRSKDSLSAAEKDRIEAIVHKAKGAVVRISNKLLPKLRDLEKRRLRSMHESLLEDWAESGDVEEKSSEIIATNDTPEDIHPGLTSAKRILTGFDPTPIDPRDQVDHPKHMRKIKNFRKMEV
jgi:hypothetical protein